MAKKKTSLKVKFGEHEKHTKHKMKHGKKKARKTMRHK